MAKAIFYKPGRVALIYLAIAVATSSALAQTAPTTITFASDPSWQAYTSDPLTPGLILLGNANQICLNASSPQPCPVGSIVYGNTTEVGWTADLSSIPGASWIWIPNVTGNSYTSPNYFYFSKTVQLPESPLGGTISIAVDDYAKIYVNDQPVGEYGSVTDLPTALAARGQLKTFAIVKELLHSGDNTITVLARNSPDSFGSCSSCLYSQNSAGVVFGGTINFGDQLGFTGEWIGFGNHEVRLPRLSSSVPESLVNSLNGNQVLAYRDLAFPGDELRFNFIRVYNSLDPYSGPLGRGWTHTYNIFLRVGTSGLISLKEADGREISYVCPDGSGPCASQTKGIFAELEKNAGGSFVLTRKNHNRLFFSASGQLMKIADQNGRALTCTYSGDNLTQITDPVGRIFDLAYDDLSNHLVNVTDLYGRQLIYGYNDSGQLISYIDPMHGETMYTYDDGGRLIAARQQNNFFSLKNTYDSQGRVSSQQNPAGFWTTVEKCSAPWLDPAFLTTAASCPAITACTAASPCTATTFKDPLGRRTTHVYDNKSRLIRIIDALGGITSYGYDDSFNRTSITDPLCHTTAFTHDALGNVISVTDAEGAVSFFTYDGSNNRLTSTNGRGNKSHIRLRREQQPNARKGRPRQHYPIHLL